MDCSDEKARIGYLSCKICGQKFSADTNPLDQPIDVYSLWIDACEDVANEQERWRVTSHHPLSRVDQFRGSLPSRTIRRAGNR